MHIHGCAEVAHAVLGNDDSVARRSCDRRCGEVGCNEICQCLMRDRKEGQG